MAKDIAKKTRGSWWYGWVRYSFYDIFSKSVKEHTRRTAWEFATRGQAKRAADILSGSMTAQDSKYNQIKVLETGADRVE